MRKELSKRIKSLIGNLANTAHERELAQRLDQLSDTLARWKKGQIETWDVMRDLDRFRHNSTRLSQKYQRSSMTPLVVAGAIAAGILREKEVPSDVLELLAQEIKYFKDGLADGTISFADEAD
jgi:hypothetical protein